MCKEENEVFENCSACARKLQAIEDKKRFHLSRNQEMFDTLAEATQLLRQALSRFRENDFVGIKCAHKYTVRHFMYPHSRDAEKESVRQPASIIKLIGKWMQPLGFEPDTQIRILAFDGLLILTPEEFKEPPGLIRYFQTLNKLIGKMREDALTDVKDEDVDAATNGLSTAEKEM